MYIAEQIHTNLENVLFLIEMGKIYHSDQEMPLILSVIKLNTVGAITKHSRCMKQLASSCTSVTLVLRLLMPVTCVMKLQTILMDGRTQEEHVDNN